MSLSEPFSWVPTEQNRGMVQDFGTDMPIVFSGVSFIKGMGKAVVTLLLKEFDISECIGQYQSMHVCQTKKKNSKIAQKLN